MPRFGAYVVNFYLLATHVMFVYYQSWDHNILNSFKTIRLSDCGATLLSPLWVWSALVYVNIEHFIEHKPPISEERYLSADLCNSFPYFFRAAGIEHVTFYMILQIIIQKSFGGHWTDFCMSALSKIIWTTKIKEADKTAFEFEILIYHILAQWFKYQVKK